MTEKDVNTVHSEANGEDAAKKVKGFDADGFWKELIARFGYQLLKRAVPELYEKADITKAYRLLDKEFTDLINSGKRNLHKYPHFVDVVLEIPMKDGTAEWVIFHCEIQGKNSDLAEKMNFYRCLIYGHYRREPVALAIITEGHKKAERFYSHNHFGTESVYRYNNLALADLDDEELQTSDNPIDLALYAAKCALRAKEEHQKLNYMRTLLGLLSERGWSEDDKYDLLLFLERIMDLQDEVLEKEYVEYRTQLKREGKIMYIPLGERELAREIEQRGMAKGKEEMAQEMARNLLANGVPPDVIAKSAGLPVEQIRALEN